MGNRANVHPDPLSLGLHDAVRTAPLWAVKTLAHEVADLNAPDADGNTPLHCAAISNRSPTVIDTLLAAGADVDARTKAGARRNKGDWGFTPLHDAARHANLVVAKALLDAGADVAEVTRRWGWTPIHFAAAYNPRASVLGLLLAYGASLRAQDRDGRTPLHSAAWHNSNSAVIKTLLKAGALLRAKTGVGSTPLHDAASNRNPARSYVAR